MAEEKEAPAAKQAPVKPKKRGGGEVKMPILIGTVIGTVILMAAIFYAVFWFGIKPYMSPDEAAEGDKAGDTLKVEVDETADLENMDDPEQEFLHGEVGIHFIRSGRITTNPKATTQIVLLDLGMEFRAKAEDERFPEGEKVDNLETKPEFSRMLASVKGKINSMLGSYTVEDLYKLNRDTLTEKFRTSLKPIFKKEKLYLRDIILMEFLIQ